MMVHKWVGRAARACGRPLNWTSLQISFGTVSEWKGCREYPSYALWLVCGLEGPAVLSIRASQGILDSPLEGQGPGEALMWSPMLDAAISLSRRCRISVVAFQHGARDVLTKASLNRLKAVGFSIDAPAAWVAPRRIALDIEDVLKGGTLHWPCGAGEPVE